jgi:hypothetical protein
MKAYRQDFLAIATLVTGGKPTRLTVADITKDSMRHAFAAYARDHEAASIRPCANPPWSLPSWIGTTWTPCATRLAGCWCSAGAATVASLLLPTRTATCVSAVTTPIVMISIPRLP